MSEPEPPPASKKAPRSKTGYLTFTSNIDGQVLDGRKKLGALPLHRLPIKPGKLQLTLLNPVLGIEKKVTVSVRADEETTLAVPVGKGVVNVNADPWAEVWLDGVKIGQTPLSREVWEGTHGVRLVASGKERSVTVQVKAGQTAVVQESLRQ